MKRNFFKNWMLFLYYALLIVVLVSWTNETPPPMAYRVFFIALLCAPVFLYSEVVLPIVLIVFCTVSKFSPYPTYMPTEPLIYAVFLGLLCLVSFSKLHSTIQIPISLLSLALYTIIIDLITSGTIQSISFCIISIVLLSLFIDGSVLSLSTFMSLAFSIASFLLSIVFLLSMTDFTVAVNASQNVERVEWTDPNYFGFVIGMGCFCAFNSLIRLNEKKGKVFYTVFFVSTIILSSVILVLNASRGALMSVLIVIPLVLLFSKVSISYKILVVIFGVVMVYYIYNSGLMDLLMYRITEGMGDGGGGRTNIWQTKFSSFMHEGNILELLFGMGYEKGYNLGFSHGQGFHNDYLAFLVDYGLVGFCLFVFPIIKMLIKGVRTNVSSFCFCLFLILCGMTLEPFTLGMFPYYLFYLFVFFYIKQQSAYIRIIVQQ